MSKRNQRALGIMITFYVLFGSYLTWQQEKIVYRPFPQEFATCENFNAATKVTHNGTRMYADLTEGQPTAVLYHGNAGSACDRNIYADIFTRAGLGYLIVEYAGYSNDPRTPSHDLVKQDVEHVVSYLREQNLTPIIVVGESIGTGAAAYHTALETPDKLLLISPFTDLKAVARGRFWLYPTNLLVDNAFNNVLALQHYPGPTLIIHGTADTIIPYRLGAELYQSLPGEKELLSINGASHNDLFLYPDMYQGMHDFLQ